MLSKLVGHYLFSAFQLALSPPSFTEREIQVVWHLTRMTGLPKCVWVFEGISGELVHVSWTKQGRAIVSVDRHCAVV